MIYSPGWELIKSERQRQIVKEGWTPEHDLDMHQVDDLQNAAQGYRDCPGPSESIPTDWPWEWEWKPKDRLRNLVRAGALYLAAAELADARGEHVRAKTMRDNAVLCNHAIENEHLIPA